MWAVCLVNCTSSKIIFEERRCGGKKTMSQLFSKDWKCCTTCANWAGFRKVHYSGAAETESIHIKGKCYAGVFSSDSAGFVATAQRSCPKYQKWAGLR